MVLTGHVTKYVSGTRFAPAQPWGYWNAKLETARCGGDGDGRVSRSGVCGPARKFRKPRSINASDTDSSEWTSQLRAEDKRAVVGSIGQRQRTRVAWSGEFRHFGETYRDGASKHKSGTTTTTSATGPTAINFNTTPVGSKLTKNVALQSKLATRLTALGYGGTVFEAAYGFKNLGQFVAATNVSRNLGIPFEQLKLQMTGLKVDATGKVLQANVNPDGSIITGRSGERHACRADQEPRSVDSDTEAGRQRDDGGEHGECGSRERNRAHDNDHVEGRKEEVVKRSLASIVACAVVALLVGTPVFAQGKKQGNGNSKSSNAAGRAEAMARSRHPAK